MEPLAWYIGWAPNCTIRITNDSYVACEHARIVRTLDGHVYIEPRAGFVFLQCNGSPKQRVLPAGSPLHPGDIIWVGQTPIPMTPASLSRWDDGKWL